MVKFCIARALRTTIHDLVHRSKPLRIHNYMPSEFVVPSFVFALLSKGSKFIPDSQNHHIVDILHSFQRVHRALRCGAFFSHADFSEQCRKRRLSIPSRWNPPADAVSDSLAHCLTKDLVAEYRPLKRRRNFSYWDHQALRWLRENKSQVVVADCDKGLGDGLFPREWVQRESLRLLEEAATVIDNDTFIAANRSAADAVIAAVEYASAWRIIPHKLARFLVHRVGTTRCGGFRLRPKIHKSPLAARPIMSMGNSWTYPLALYLCEVLQPIHDQQCPSVLRNTDMLTDALVSYAPQPGHVIATIDIQNLYPSIDQEHMLSVLNNIISAYYRSNPALSHFIRSILYIIIKSQWIEFAGKTWQITTGLATGLSCAVFLANMYLSAEDATTRNALAPSDFYRRLVDDLIFIGAPESLSSLLLSFESRPCRLKFLLQQVGRDAIPYLDVALSLTRTNTVSWTLYRKPLNSYQFVPTSSAHPAGTFTSVVDGEAYRTLRSCKNFSDAQAQLKFLSCKLRDRGYDLIRVRSRIARLIRRFTVSHDRPSMTSSPRTRNVALVVPYSSCTNTRVINKILKRHSSGVHTFKLGFTVQRNLFRLLHRSNWRHTEDY